MGMIISKVEGDKIVSMNMEAPVYKGVIQTLDNNKQLQKYRDYLNKNGFIVVKVNIKILNDLLLRIYNKLDLQDPPQEIKDFKNSIKFNETGLGPIYGMVILYLGMASMSGFFTIREGGVIKAMTDMSATKSNEMNISDPNIEIIFPKILIQNNNNEFIDYLFNDFHPETQNGTPQNYRNALDIILDGVNKNTSKGDVRLANVINLTFNSGLIFGLMNYFMKFDPKNTPIIIAGLIAETIGSFPDDYCYFSNESIISFNPNVCDIPRTQDKIQAQKAVSCPNNSSLVLICGVLGLLALLFFFLYVTVKPKIIRVPMALSDTDND